MRNTPFKLMDSVKEDHGKALFGVNFNRAAALLPEPKNIFATVGSNRTSIYECKPNGSLDLLQAYVDDNTEEIYYTCAWSYDESNGDPILAVAGALGIIRIIRPAQHKHVKSFTGHGNAINELQFHPKDPNLLLSVSKDHALRLWNLKTHVCIIIFGGEKGHRDEVLSGDFILDGSRIISCGMDHLLKIWSLDTDEARDAIARSYKYDSSKEGRIFDTLCIHFPTFSTSAVHSNYVDCVRWFGELVFSKSTDNRIVCWKPGGEARLDLDEKKTAYFGDPVTILYCHEYSKCDIWYVRFSIDPTFNLMAVGNQDGTVYVWNLCAHSKPAMLLDHKKCTHTVRQTCFNSDGSILVYVCDDGSVWRWDQS